MMIKNRRFSPNVSWLKMSGMVFFLVLSVFVHGASVSPINPVERSEDIAFSNTPQMYGSWLFEGGFSEASFSGLNPAYKISQGDLLLVQIWGGLDFQAELKVDAQGNVFIPKVGPVRLAGVTNAELNRVLLNAVKRVYKSNVNTYVTLQSTQKVKVFLAGLVSKPGLYEGQSADSLLKFIDQAGGIRESLGGYRQIELKRNLEVIAQFDLYQFISHGNLPLIQLLEGDVIFVGASKGEVSIEGDVSFSGRYEISANNSDLSEILAAVSPTSRATHVTIIEASGLEVNAKQISIAKAAGQTIKAGARIKISSQQRPSSISVEVLGEHDSAREMILPVGASLKDVLESINFTRRSNQSGIQLYRASVAAEQKEMLAASLSLLERNVLTTPSSTNEAALLRKVEAEGVLSWISRARQVEPRGQIILTEGFDPSAVLLRQGDRIVIPSVNSIVQVHGDVTFPAAIVFKHKQSVMSYLNQAGGVSGRIKNKMIFIKKPNGSFLSLKGSVKYRGAVEPGDEIFVLSKPEVKSLQLTKDISQVLYQIAIAAAVVVAF